MLPSFVLFVHIYYKQMKRIVYVSKANGMESTLVGKDGGFFGVLVFNNKFISKISTYES